MKILHLYKTYYPNTFGGVEKFIDQLIMSLSAYGVESEVLVLTKDKVELTTEINGYKVHKITQDFEIASCPFSIKAIGHLKQMIKRFDIIHYHFPWPFADIMHFLSYSQKPTLITYHSDIVKQQVLLKLYAPLMNAFLKSVNRVVATSPKYLESSHVLKRFKEKTIVIPIGLDKNKYLPPDNEKLHFWRSKFSSKFLLFIGTIRYYKGLAFLIEAAKGLDIPIVIAGASNRLENELKTKAYTLGLQNVFFLGELPEEDKIALLILCYALILPSHLRSEAFGISLLEGAMFGKPLISCEINTGTTYINIANETGIVVPPADSIALNTAIRYLFDNQNQASIMGKNAKKRFEEFFTEDKMALSYINLYKQLLDIY